MDYHTPVLLAEAIEYLQVKPGKKFIDATLGDGGHTLEILKCGGVVLGLDVSEISLTNATKRIEQAGYSSNFLGVLGNFRNLEKLARSNDFTSVDGVLYDLGYSSTQLASDETGLSFIKDQPLDMRLSSELGVTAADLVNSLSEKELSGMFFTYSDERLSKRFAKAIIEHRKLKKIQSTKDLADLIKSVSPSGYEYGRIHPATRVFQALRIAVNSEFENLEVSLPQAAHLLLPGGRMIVISFHSLEDKLVKEFGQSVRPKVTTVLEKPIVPSETEVAENIRSRSAKMRVFEKN